MPGPIVVHPNTPVVDPPTQLDPSILPTAKPVWYTMLVGYRTIISILVSSVLKLLAVHGILATTATSHAEDVVNIVMLAASFIADGSSIYFKLRAPAPGKFAPPQAVTNALISQAEKDAAALAQAVIDAQSLIQKAQVSSQRSQISKMLRLGVSSSK